MSRVANKPIEVPKGVEISVTDDAVQIKGPKGQMSQRLLAGVKVVQQDNLITLEYAPENGAMAGTSRALISNIVYGVSQGFEKKLLIQGVGYRAQMQGNVLNLTLGLSHPVNYPAPEGITIEAPTQTEIVVKGVDKQVVGQVAAEIRAFRPPEPYKGKGIRYADEIIVRKETKKK